MTAAAVVVLTLISTIAAGCSFGTAEEDQLLGRWRVVSFTDENGQPEAVVVGGNTARQPALTFEQRDGEYLAGGSLGCNTLGPGVYTLDGDRLSIVGAAVTGMACELEIDGEYDEESAMRAEEMIGDILGDDRRTVGFDGDDRATLIVRSAGGEMILERVGGAAAVDDEADGNRTATAPVGPLDCGDRVRVEEHLVDSGLSQAEAARVADPDVVRTDNNLSTTFGFDADDTIIVEVQNTDSGIGDYLVYTCSDE